jgi:hypothetical protein
MSHPKRLERATSDSGPIRLANAVEDAPEDSRLAIKPGCALPAGLEPMLGIDDWPPS